MTIMLRRIDYDQAFVWGKTADTARALLAACTDLGLPPSVVQTVDNGFLVPATVADHIHPPVQPGAEF